MVEPLLDDLDPLNTTKIFPDLFDFPSHSIGEKLGAETDSKAFEFFIGTESQA